MLPLPLMWGSKNNGRDIMEKTTNEVGSTANSSDKKIAVAEQLVIIGMRGVTLFHTPDGTAYGGVMLDNGGTDVLPMSGMKELVVQRYYKEKGKVPSKEAVNNSIRVLDAIAKHDMQEIDLYIRVAREEDTIIYDLTNDAKESVVISKDGWQISQRHKPIFKKYAHQKAQVTPITGGDVNRLFEVVNVVESDRLMCLVHLISSLVPEISHTVPDIYGEHGSAKSGASRIFKALIDPSILDSPGLPNTEEGMHQAMAHHWYIIFDNVSWIKDWQSDIICKSSTGATYQKRALYTNDGDFVLEYKNCTGFNGITVLATRGDLLDRMVTLRLSTIDERNRKEEIVIKNMFADMHPEVLGAMFDILSKAMEIYPSVEIGELPRMADFAKWGCAITEAMGYSQKEFLDMYYLDISNNDLHAIESTPVAELIITFMERRDIAWEGSPRELWNELSDILDSREERRSEVSGMKNVQSLGKSYDRIVPNLRRFGIEWSKPPRKSTKRLYRIEKHLKNEVTSVTSGDECEILQKHNASDDNDEYDESDDTSFLNRKKEDIDIEVDNSRSPPPLIGKHSTLLDTTRHKNTNIQPKDIDNDKKSNVYGSGDKDGKLRHAIGKALYSSSRNEVTTEAITEAYPEITTISRVEKLLEQRGTLLGIKKTPDGLWRVA